MSAERETLLPALTAQQTRAMRSFCWGIDGIDDQATDTSAWNEGVRPWPTMGNLVKKGLIETVEWVGHEDGWLYKLTPLGRDYMREVMGRV